MKFPGRKQPYIKSNLERQKKIGTAFIIFFLQLSITFWDSSQIRNNMATDRVYNWHWNLTSDNKSSVHLNIWTLKKRHGKSFWYLKMYFLWSCCKYSRKEEKLRLSNKWSWGRILSSVFGSATDYRTRLGQILSQGEPSSQSRRNGDDNSKYLFPMSRKTLEKRS